MSFNTIGSHSSTRSEFVWPEWVAAGAIAVTIN